MNMEAVFRKPKLLRTLTTLDPAEFERLVVAFDTAWQAKRDEHTFDGQQRRRKRGGGHKGTFPTTRAKLFFVLFYFKCYPLQEVMALLFGLSQGQVSHWVGELTPLVNTALGRELLLPARKPADMGKLLSEVPDVLLLIDGSERPIRRPKNKDDQKGDYSGKKKAHRKKNLLVTREREVIYLGPTSPGSVHDKKLADESELSFPPESLVLKDSAFQGYEPPGPATLQPKKKPRHRELYPSEKALNQLLSRYRVTVEHAIAGIKRCRIVLDTFRCWRRGLVDEVMLAASGLQNLRVRTRQLA